MGLFRRRRPAPSDPLGSGVWRRAYDDCATAPRRTAPLVDRATAARLDAAASAVLGSARTAAQRWPADGLDVPADPAARAAYDRLRAVAAASREVAYRVSLLARGAGAAEQEALLARALDTLGAAVAELERGRPA
ncbi:MAG TPA: hypothetical protein VK894_00995 [Jiangellales bacterium]|nr:hypothetical protein [Jiangellales bacterium]